ncbi:probable G-protein coupled receptor Mth-like 14 [Lutzomyia longipalpis]|uniref:probable G-protein coupled receptor Mth-like 14 n=1 Tax=Lutzomyia longipalpis TaxID=7200 RepID=UPI0024834FFD|nr:probable G-protein coupled receptor Mth-like 14 [Lutzomyia longipalpis]XP_055692389.1 probable G-protein coupled receptor Mth-like 14 [Lutzomyia longipalpis]XP_055692390.1 probable G-protein coupled receptor Mth-like 14 [Lutzomyia longipalpis]XP_055692391.1 probable G-protein coupled receptor Mth-like 14 [Lutzomyia longipalpis]XP_055692392.1 probable G-protein coupled receptor Mth-like 14 [Lutzomyia longipalpis]XP_055692393.1 probable G-protein coupled receptor Mth-like 14 [Lutzomyia longip
MTNHLRLIIVLIIKHLLSITAENQTEVAPLNVTTVINHGNNVPTTTVSAVPIGAHTEEILENVPPTCHNLKRLPTQPELTEASAIRKCCPAKENLIHNDPKNHGCHATTQPFMPPIVNATFYEGCIEDEETSSLRLPERYGNPCAQRQSFVYSRHDGDVLYVLLNGSLLVVNERFEWIEIRDEYCLDTDDNGTLSAIICPDEYGSSTPEAAVTQAQLVFLAICMLISIPCLLVTSFFYFTVDDLRTLHGKSLACHCLCLALRFILIAIIQLHIAGESDVTFSNYFIYMIQYFILAAFFWQFVMSVDIVINVWYYLPKNISPKGTLRGWIHFAIYSTLSMLLPIVFICAAMARHEPETPYFLKGVSWDEHSNQNFYILPVIVLLCLCFGCFIGAYYGFRQLNELNIMVWLTKMKNTFNRKHEPDTHFTKLCTKEMEYVKQSAKATFYMYCIQAICFIFEIISFYANGNNIILMFDTINALQGLLILTIFVCFPHTLKIIKSWWKDRGSHVVTEANPAESIPLRDIKGDASENKY